MYLGQRNTPFVLLDVRQFISLRSMASQFASLLLAYHLFFQGIAEATTINRIFLNRQPSSNNQLFKTFLFFFVTIVGSEHTFSYVSQRCVFERGLSWGPVAHADLSNLWKEKRGWAIYFSTQFYPTLTPLSQSADFKRVPGSQVWPLPGSCRCSVTSAFI